MGSVWTSKPNEKLKLLDLRKVEWHSSNMFLDTHLTYSQQVSVSLSIPLQKLLSLKISHIDLEDI